MNGASMSDIKKIAADIRHRAEWHDPVKIEWADALDALASQSQEPVAEVHSGQLRWLVQDEAQPNNCTLYAAPQRPTVSREALWTAYANELRKGTPVGAFDNFCVALRALSIEVQE